MTTTDVATILREAEELTRRANQATRAVDGHHFHMCAAGLFEKANCLKAAALSRKHAAERLAR